MLYQFPETGLVRIFQIIGDSKGHPPFIPVSRATWWRGVKEGRYPPAVYVTPTTPAWRAEDIHRLVETGNWRLRDAKTKRDVIEGSD